MNRYAKNSNGKKRNYAQLEDMSQNRGGNQDNNVEPHN